jgi:hypothetical protein
MSLKGSGRPSDTLTFKDGFISASEGGGWRSTGFEVDLESVSKVLESLSSSANSSIGGTVSFDANLDFEEDFDFDFDGDLEECFLIGSCLCSKGSGCKSGDETVEVFEAEDNLEELSEAVESIRVESIRAGDVGGES